MNIENADFDGDALYGIAIKETDMVPTLMNMHPSTTMIGDDIPEITTNVQLTRQENLTFHAWLNQK